MKRYAEKQKKENKTGSIGSLKQRVKAILAFGLAVVMVVMGMIPWHMETGWQTVRAESVLPEISMTSYIEQGETGKDFQITICSAQEMRLFAQYVNQGNDTAGKTFYLKNDITLSSLTSLYDSSTGRTGIYRGDNFVAAADKDGRLYKTLTASTQTSVQVCMDKEDIWEPIGNERYPFQGYFQMNGCAIRGMAVVADGSDQGLFGVIGNEGIVQNGKIENSLVLGGTAAGGIAGSNQGIVKESSCQNIIAMGNGCVGGVTGNNTGSITQVTAESIIVVGKSSTITTERDDIEPENGAGGIVGYQMQGTIQNCTLQGASSDIVNGGGGIFGYMTGGTVENCSNYSELDSLGANLGGIGGFIFGGKILSCHNYGNISYTYQYDLHINLGGIVAGSLCDNFTDILINECVNEGDILQKEREDSTYGRTLDSVGGIIGRMGGGILGNCGNAGTVGIVTEKDDSAGARLGGVNGVLQVGGIVAGSDGVSLLRNCYNTGDILGDIAYTGGIAGRSNSVELRACYTIGKISQKLGTGQITGYAGGGDIVDCFYLEGDDISLYSEASGGFFKVSNARGVSGEEVENSLIDELNRCVLSYGMDYFQQNCPLRKWCKDAQNHPVLSEEYLIKPQETRQPDVTRVPAASTEPGGSGAPVSSSQPETSEDPGVSSRPETSEDPGVSSQPETSEDPVVSSQPETSKDPVSSGQPETSGSPVSSRLPETSKTPVSGQNPDSSEKPSGTPDPSRIQKAVSLSLAESPQIARVKKLTVRSAQNGRLRITWNASGQNICYGIYRREGKKGSYKKLTVVTGKTTWLDKRTRKGKKYRYQIFACRQENNTLLRSGVTESKWIETAHYSAPKVTYQTEYTEGKRYLKLTLRQYRGDHIDIVLRKNGKEQIIKLHSISRYHGVFRFSYTRTGDFMYCKVRTWENRSGQKRFSEYTNMKKIKL